MKMIENAVLITGSPRGKSSTSRALLNYIADGLKEKGVETGNFWVHNVLKREDNFTELLTSIEETDLIILASPLYVDCLPAPVIKALKMIKDHRDKKGDDKEQGFCAIVNSGFPEAFQNDIAISIYRKFAEEIGFRWLGGLTLGMGEAIHGKPLNDAGGMARNVRKSLDIAVSSLTEGKEIPEEAKDLMRKPFIPKWLYKFLGNWGWRREAKEYGTKDRLKDKPHTED